MKYLMPYTFRQKSRTIKNRIALAPMTNGQSQPDGTLGEDEYHWLVRRARGGFGMIFTCAAYVSRDGQGWPGELGIWDDRHIPGLTRVAAGIRQYGAAAVVQLFHGGARSPEVVTGTQPWSASAHLYVPGKTEVQVREATPEDIHRVILHFRDAAVRAYKAGFDGVELHAAHGYLLHQFLSTATNRRTDEWGGKLEHRSRLLIRIIHEIKKAVPDDFLVGVRISPEDKYTFRGIDFDDSLLLAEMLSAAGTDFLDVSTWNALKKPDKYTDSQKALITYFREILPEETALITAGEIWTAQDAEKVMELGADIISLGRVGIAHPDWPLYAADKDYTPDRPPFTPNYLASASLGADFIQYMRKWQGFVKDEHSTV